MPNGMEYPPLLSKCKKNTAQMTCMYNSVCVCVFGAFFKFFSSYAMNVFSLCPDRFYSTDFYTVVQNLTKLLANQSAAVVYTLSGVTFPTNQTFIMDTVKLRRCIHPITTNTSHSSSSLNKILTLCFLFRALFDSRVIKTDSEIKMMRVAITVSA